MKIRNLINPNTSLFDPKTAKFYKFVNGVADVPEALGTELLQTGEYDMIGSLDSKIATIKFNPETWNVPSKKIILDIPIDFSNGYGKSGIMMAKGLIVNGHNVRVIQNRKTTKTLEHVPQEVVDAIVKGDERMDGFYIKYHMGSAFQRRHIDRFIGYTMLEASLIPESYVKAINEQCERVIVPCKQNKQAFIDSGVKCDIGVVPLGLDLDIFPKLDREREDGTFVFGVMGGLTYRKGVDVLIEAFKKAFTKKDNVHLFIKSLPWARLGSGTFLKSEDLHHPQITTVFQDWDPEELIEKFFAAVDCFVFPTRGEGFGLPPLEAMATGLPVICTNWSGPEEFMRDNHSYPLDYNLVDMPGAPLGYPKELYREGQKWAAPDVDHLVELMRHVYENRDKAKAKGDQAAGYVRRHFSTENVAKKLVKYLDSKF